MTSPRIEPIDNCIANIERAGWKLETRQDRWYRFSPVSPRSDGRTFICFTLTEIRDAFNNGW